MFDGLKESLGRFRDDVEETADVEEVDEEAGEGADDEADAVDGDQGAVEDDVDAVEDGEGEDGAVDASDGSAVGPDADTSPEETVAGVEDEEAAGDADDEAAPGFTKRAKSLATGKVYIDEDDLDDPLWDLEMALLENDVAMDVAGDLTDRLKKDLSGERRAITTRTGSIVEDALSDALLDVLSVGQFDFEDRIADAVEEDTPAVVIFTGVNGVGKTTTIAKVARFLEERGYSSVLANGDTFRAGANEQIEEHADNLGVKLISHDRGGDPAAVIYDGVEYAQAHDIDVVLGDTAGRLHTSEDLMAQLEKIGRVVGPDMTIFVDESVAGQDAVERAREFDAAAEIDGAILTKADADSSGGAAISVAHVTGKPVLFLGVGQGYDDLERFDPEALVERLVGS